MFKYQIKSSFITFFSSVRPGPPENLEAEASTENSLQLTFEIPRTLIHFPAGLIFAVRYRSNWSMDWSSWTSKDVKNMEKETYSLENLSYSWTKYEIQVGSNSVNFPSTLSQVRLLSGMANASDARYWSQPASAEQKTLASIPPSPPRIHPGSFEIIGGINDRTVVVFWQKLDEKLHNGEDFRYTVTDVRQEGHSEPLLPVTTTSTFMEFQKVGLGQQSIFITSENSMGQVSFYCKIILMLKSPTHPSLSGNLPGSDQCKDCGSCCQGAAEYPAKVIHKNPLSRGQCLRGGLASSQR